MLNCSTEVARTLQKMRLREFRANRCKLGTVGTAKIFRSLAPTTPANVKLFQTALDARPVVQYRDPDAKKLSQKNQKKEELKMAAAEEEYELGVLVVGCGARCRLRSLGCGVRSAK